MGRRSSGVRSIVVTLHLILMCIYLITLRSSSFRPSKPASKPTSKSTAPARVPSKASPPAVSGSSIGGIGGRIVDGLAWGGANAVSHRVADAFMGPRVVQVEHVAAPAPVVAAQSAPSMMATPNPCVSQSKAFEECLNTSGNDISRCQFYMDMLAECRKSGSSGNSASAVF